MAMFVVSLNFFFFSYHVHEKTIMFPLAVMVLSIKNFGIYYVDFTVFAMMTILKLLQEDKLLF
jgi:hypothetical protein